MKKYPIAKPHITAKEEKYVLEVLRSGILSLGPKQEGFEKKFAQKIGTKYACAVSSGTAGLHLALIAAGIKKGDEVITSPFSFIASANAILYVGAKPVFADIDLISYNINPKEIERRVTKNTKAILVVHIFGQAADMAAILRIAKKHNLKVIEDACESICAKYQGRSVGTFGESAVFAFYPNKQMTTGEGGMIVTNNKKIYEICRSLRNQGRVENLRWLEHKYIGYNYRMTEMSAAIGLAQLEKLDWMINQRKKIAGWYNKFLKPHADKIQIPRVANTNSHTWFVYVIKLLNKKLRRDKIISLLEKRGVSTKPYLSSIHLTDFYKKELSFKKGNFPVSEEMSENSLALPFYIGLKKSDIKYIVKTLISVL